MSRLSDWLLERRHGREYGRDYVLSTIPPNAVAAEIGVWQGDFSALLWATGRIEELHLIDPWRFMPRFPTRLYGGAIAKDQSDMDGIARSVQQRFADLPAIKVHRADSLDVAASFPNAHFDWIYIDGDHSYEAVLADLVAWHPKVKPNGIVWLDDYRWHDDSGRRAVKSAIEDFLARQRVDSPRLVGGQFCFRIAAPSGRAAQ